MANRMVATCDTRARPLKVGLQVALKNNDEEDGEEDLQVADRIADLRVPEAQRVAGEQEHEARAHEEQRALERGRAVRPAEEAPPSAHDQAGWFDVLAPEMLREEGVQALTREWRKVDRLNLLTGRVVSVQCGLEMELPLDRHVRVLVDAARPP